MNCKARTPGSYSLFVGSAYAAVCRLVTRTSLPGSGKASGLSRMEFTRVNMETLPPMPMLRERIAVRAKTGAERRERKALRMLSINMVTLQLGYPRVGIPFRNYPAKRQFVLILSTETQSCGGMCSLLERMTAKTDSSSRPGLFATRSHACRSGWRGNGRQPGSCAVSDNGCETAFSSINDVNCVQYYYKFQ